MNRGKEIQFSNLQQAPGLGLTMFDMVIDKSNDNGSITNDLNKNNDGSSTTIKRSTDLNKNNNGSSTNVQVSNDLNKKDNNTKNVIDLTKDNK